MCVRERLTFLHGQEDRTGGSGLLEQLSKASQELKVCV